MDWTPTPLLKPGIPPVHHRGRHFSKFSSKFSSIPTKMAPAALVDSALPDLGPSALVQQQLSEARIEYAKLQAAKRSNAWSAEKVR